MKKLFLIFCTLSFVFCTLALSDTDSDGVGDEADMCPRVYAVTTTGCPTLTAPSIPPFANICLNKQLEQGKFVANIVPLCTGDSCPKLSSLSGLQLCDPIFPVVIDASGVVLVRGSVYIIQ